MIGRSSALASSVEGSRGRKLRLERPLALLSSDEDTDGSGRTTCSGLGSTYASGLSVERVMLGAASSLYWPRSILGVMSYLPKRSDRMRSDDLLFGLRWLALMVCAIPTRGCCFLLGEELRLFRLGDGASGFPNRLEAVLIASS